MSTCSSACFRKMLTTRLNPMPAAQSHPRRAATPAPRRDRAPRGHRRRPRPAPRRRYRRGVRRELVLEPRDEELVELGEQLVAPGLEGLGALLVLVDLDGLLEQLAQADAVGAPLEDAQHAEAGAPQRVLVVAARRAHAQPERVPPACRAGRPAPRTPRPPSGGSSSSAPRGRYCSRWRGRPLGLAALGERRRAPSRPEIRELRPSG